MKKKILSIGLVLAMSMVMLTACGGGSSEGSATSAKSEKEESISASEITEAESKSEDGSTAGGKIAIVPMSLNDPYQIVIANAAKAECEELGYEGVIQAPGSGNMGDVNGQVELVENLIANGTYSGIILAPISKDGGIILAKNCQDANIPLVIMDSQIDQDTLEADGYEKIPFIGTGNYNAAVATGEWIRENYDEGVKMAKINGPDGHDNGEARKKGIDDGLDGWADVVAEQATTWGVDDAYTATQNIISANPDIKLIWCACDALGVGCVRALEEANKQDDIDVIAYDGTTDGLNLVLAKSEVANTAQYPDKIGIGAVDIMDKVLKGEDVELITDSGFEIVVPETAQQIIDRLAQYN